MFSFTAASDWLEEGGRPGGAWLEEVTWPKMDPVLYVVAAVLLLVLLLFATRLGRQARAGKGSRKPGRRGGRDALRGSGRFRTRASASERMQSVFTLLPRPEGGGNCSLRCSDAPSMGLPGPKGRALSPPQLGAPVCKKGFCVSKQGGGRHAFWAQGPLLKVMLSPWLLVPGFARL